jgi:hypothetical protein
VTCVNEWYSLRCMTSVPSAQIHHGVAFCPINVGFSLVDRMRLGVFVWQISLCEPNNKKQETKRKFADRPTNPRKMLRLTGRFNVKFCSWGFIKDTHVCEAQAMCVTWAIIWSSTPSTDCANNGFGKPAQRMEVSCITTRAS